MINKRMDKVLKGNIDKSINRLLEKKAEFQITSIALIKMMHDDGKLEGEMGFYARIVEAILNEDKSLSYDEKEQFLILHKSLIEVYNECG